MTDLLDQVVVARPVEHDRGHVVDAAAERLIQAGLDLAAITAQLEREGVSSFCDSYHQLLGCIERKLAATEAAPRG